MSYLLYMPITLKVCIHVQ